MTDAAELVKPVEPCTMCNEGWRAISAAWCAACEAKSVSFGAEESYILFLIVDTEARWLKGQNEATNALREKLLPAYREWHRAHPFEVHPHTTQVCEQMQQLRRPEQ